MLAASVLAVLLLVYVVDYLPTNDGPQHAYVGFLSGHSHEEPFSRYYARSWPLAQSWYVVFSNLEALIGWREAYRMAIALTLLSWTLGSAAIVCALPRERRVLILVASIGASQWAVYMGFFPWLCSAGMGLGSIALVMPDEGDVPRRRRWISMGALLFLASSVHPFGGQLGGAGVLAHTLLAVPRSGWRARLPWLAAVGTFPVIVTVSAAMGVADAALHPVMIGHRSYYPPWADRLRGFSWFYAAGPWYRGWPPVVVAAAGSMAALLRIRKLLARERALVLVAALYTTMALLAPRHGSVWQNFSPRFVPPAVLLWSLLLPLERLRERPRWLVQLVLSAVAAVSIGWAVSYNVRLRESSQPWLAALGKPSTKGNTLLAIVTETVLDGSIAKRKDYEIPYARPHVNTGLIYALDREAVSPYTFAWFPRIHVVLDREALPRSPGRDFQDAFFRPRADAEMELVRIAGYGSHFDEFLFFGQESGINLLLGLGYEPIHRSERLLLSRFRGCPIELEVTGDLESAPRLTLVVMWEPWPRSVWDETWQPGALPSKRRLGHTSCAVNRIRVVPADPGLACRGATDRFDFYVHGGETVRCHLEQEPTPQP